MLESLNPFAKPLLFHDFILAAQQVGPQESLVLRRGKLVRKLSLDEKEEKRLNRATWCAFRRAVQEAFSPERLESICTLYKFDWKKMVNSDLPFERRYLEYFGVGACSVKTTDLARELRDRSWFGWSKLYDRGWFGETELKCFSTEQIHELYTEATHGTYLGKTEDPKNLHGAPTEGHENFIHDRFRVDRRRCNLLRGIVDLVSPDPSIPRLHPYYSRLNMAIISLLETGKKNKDAQVVIPAPGEMEGEVEYYEVYDIISKEGLNAFALVPISQASNLRPLLVFRCTKQSVNDGVSSWLNDMEENIGESGYLACKKEFERLMQDKHFHRGKKVNVLCYSLGGAHAGYFMRDHWRHIQECVCFNFVGNEQKVIEDLSKEINALGKDQIPPAFYLHRNRGDWVNNTGQKHLGWGIHHPNGQVHLYEWEVDDLPKPKAYIPTEIPAWLNIHGARPMDSRPEESRRGKHSTRFPYRYTYYSGPLACDPHLTYERDSRFEELRRAYGHKVLFNVVNFFYSLSDFILRILGIEFFKKNL
jgi:hypothetical protein